MSKDIQPVQVSGHGMIEMVARGHPPQPFTDQRDRLVPPAAQLHFDYLELGDHPLLCRFAPYGEGAVPQLPTIMCEAQEREGLRFSLPTLLPVKSGEPPELDPS